MDLSNIGDKVVCVDGTNSDNVVEGLVYTIKDVHTAGWILLEEVDGLYYPSRFERVKEPPKPASFKNFLSPMCRVEMRNGDVAIFIDGSFVGDGSVVGSVSQWLDDGKVAPPFNVGLNKELEIVRVLEKPPYLANIFFEDHFGNVLWECPELAAKRKEKDEKIAFKQIEINMAQRKLDELVKQLKEIE